MALKILIDSIIINLFETERNGSPVRRKIMSHWIQIRTDSARSSAIAEKQRVSWHVYLGWLTLIVQSTEAAYFVVLSYLT